MMIVTRAYVKIFIVFGLPLYLADAIGIKQDTEEKDIRKPVTRLNHNANDNQHNYFHKRQINPEFTQLGQSVEPQYFQQPFVPQNPNFFADGQLTNPGLDEETRFFLSGETTTLNPLSFGTTPTTTQNPIQQQLADEQRRFQQEIADKGLREQQERSFGVPRPRTTTPPPPPPQPQLDTVSPYDQPEQPFLFNPVSSSVVPQLDSGLPYTDEYNQAYYPVREYRSVGEKTARAIDSQLASHNDHGYFSSTVSPRSYFGSLIQHSTPKEDLTQIGNWLIDNLTKQIQKNIAQLTDGTSKRHSTPKPTSSYSTETPKPTPYYSENPYTPTPTPYYSTASPTPYYSTAAPTPQYSTPAPTPHYSTAKPTAYYTPKSTYSTETPKQNYGFHSTELPYSIASPLDHSTEAPIQIPIYQSTPLYQSTPNTVDVTSLPNWNAIRSINFENFDPQKITLDDFESKKIKNVQILPYSSEAPFDNTVYQAYKQLYDIDHQTLRPLTSTVSVDLPSPQLSDTVSVTSLFKSKLKELKEREKTNQIDSDFQQHNRFFDQLQNTTENSISNDVNPATAIFIKVPDTPTSTVGFLFDKTITKNIHKKENAPAKNKNNNRSAQVVKSSLVYRTPPGKRATVSRSEVSANNQVEPGLLSNFLLGESPRTLRWLLGNNTPTTTSRPFVTALLNLIQKRATGEAA